ncbi:MAG TPA: FHA domain-containing protein [Polyangiaceae bacterium]|nr:FHA domain-containing protein [Polyangiaceae bacterium]
MGPEGPGDAVGGPPGMGPGAAKYGPPQGPSTGQGGYAASGGPYPPPMPGGGGGGYPPTPSGGGPGYPPAPPPPQGGFGGGNPGYGQPPPYGQGYQPPQQGFGPGPQQGGFGPPQQPGGFGPPQQPGGFGPPQQGGFGPPQPSGFGPPQQPGGFGPGSGGGGGYPGQSFGGGAGSYGPPPAADPLAATDFANARPGNAPPNPYGGGAASANGAFGGAAAAPAGQRELVGFLISYQADPLGSFWPLYSGRNLVGRAGAAEGLDISIADPTTSSNHAAFYIDAQSRATHVEDLGSTNGTFVNEDAIGPRGRRELRDNDRVRLGGFSMVIKVVPRL